jgi:hypothetical protein
LNILTLVGRFGRDLFLSGRVEARFGEIVAQAEGAVFGNLRKSFAQLFVSTSAGSPSIDTSWPRASILTSSRDSRYLMFWS